MGWIRDSWRYARREPLPALAFTFGLLTVTLSAITGFGAWRVALDLEREEKDRVQMACEISFANGQALLDTFADDVEPETVERYGENLQRRTNEVIQRYDPEFDCKIPEETEEPEKDTAP